MTDAVVLPYHGDDRLGDGDIELPATLEADVVDPLLPDADRWTRLVALYDALADAVAHRVGVDGQVAVLTGDCLATLGTLVGLQRAGIDPALVWFDAHGDVHTTASSTSGYLGGMALRMALGGDAERLGLPLGLRALPESRAVLVGARDLDHAERTYLDASEVWQLAVDEADPSGMPEGPVLVHIDIDVIDAGQVPGLRFPVGDGPTTAAVAAALGRLVASGRVVGVDIACPWYPVSDAAARTARQELLAILLAEMS